MSRRRSILIFLIAALSALALSVGVAAAGPDDVRVDANAGEAAVGRERAPGLDAALVRVRLDEPRGVAGSQRFARADLPLFAVLGALTLLPWLLSRATFTRSLAVGVPVLWRSPISGRAPPHLQLAVS